MEWRPVFCCILLYFCCAQAVDRNAVYIIDDSAGLGRRFDGIGAISGGGVSKCVSDNRSSWDSSVM